MILMRKPTPLRTRWQGFSRTQGHSAPYTSLVHFTILSAFGNTPPPTAFVPAAGLNFPALTMPTAALSPPKPTLPPTLPKTGIKLLLKNPATGKIVHLANAGVAHTLNTNLTGNNNFVTAYAVASSTTILTPPSPRPHHLPALLPKRPSFASSPITSPSSIQPFRLRYLPNFSTPAFTKAPSAIHGGSQSK
ncbi:hypothetical protein MBLNU13_g02104t1 [Cladosporium sp. NU13]